MSICVFFSPRVEAVDYWAFMLHQHYLQRKNFSLTRDGRYGFDVGSHRLFHDTKREEPIWPSLLVVGPFCCGISDTRRTTSSTDYAIKNTSLLFLLLSCILIHSYDEFQRAVAWDMLKIYTSFIEPQERQRYLVSGSLYMYVYIYR